MKLPDNIRVVKQPTLKLFLRRLKVVLFDPLPHAEISLLYLITPNTQDFAGRLEKVYTQLIDLRQTMLSPQMGTNIIPTDIQYVTKVNDWIAAVHFFRMYGALVLPLLYFGVAGIGVVIVRWINYLLGPCA